MKKERKNSSPQGSIKDTTAIITIRLGARKVRLPRFITWPVIVFTGAVLGCILLFPYKTTVQSFDLPKQGDASKETIIAPFTFDILKTREELEQDRKEAVAQVVEVFDRDFAKQKLVRDKMLQFRSFIFAMNDEHISDSVKSRIKSSLKREVSEKTVNTFRERPYLLDDVLFQTERMLETGILSILLVSSEQKLLEQNKKYNKEFQNYLIYDKTFITVMDDSLELTVKHSDLPVKEAALESIIYTLKVERLFDQEALNSVYELLDAYIVPNIMLNGEETQARKRQAEKSVLTFKGKVIKDTEIVRKHQEVTAEIVERLLSLHFAIQQRHHDQEIRRILRNNAGKVTLIILLLVLIGSYIRVYHPDVFENPRYLTALASIVLFQFLVIRGGLFIVPRLFESGTEIGTVVPEYFIPTSIGSILVAILFGLRLSIVTTLFISIYFSAALTFNHSLFLYSLLGGLIAGYATQRIRYRLDFFKAIPPMAVACTVYILLWNMMSYTFSLVAVTQNIGLGIINCIITTFFAMMFVIVFEHLFDITTNMTLVELSDMNNPLLKRLSIEAAGTYNHSVLVANLAESAAECVGANPLLARVAAYYHDAGKIAKPNYFVENQKSDKNIHDKLSPSMSALIISSHIKEGIELAKKYKLPSVIKDAILQHHGTSTVSFFYEKAVEQDPHNQVKEKDFCYPGPRPQTRENAIIMLADSIEAASRSLSISSPKMLRSLVKKIIHDKFASSQLDECDLTFKDLDKIIEGFMPVLQGIFHTRIEYPTKKSGE